MRKLGHVSTDFNVPSIDLNVTLNDTHWFRGNILHYNYSCKDCHQSGARIHLQNHVTEIGDIVASKAIYDMESTHDGIFAQQYDAVFKTFKKNDSIELTWRIPTEIMG